MRRFTGWMMTMCWLALCGHPAAADVPTARYNFVETKELVSLVEDAAGLVEREGTGAFTAFAEKGSKWLEGDHYIFVYTPDGTDVFHPVEPGLIGRNLIDLRDMDGKPVIGMITDVARKPERDARGWVFYLWEYQTQLTPIWKSAYIRKAVAPDGQVYLVGSGVYNLKIERAFVQERVQLAADTLRRDGRAAAFAKFRDTASDFVFLGAYVFVLDGTAHTVVDPAYPSMAGRDLSGLTDAVGMHVMAELLAKLANSDDAWVQYLWPRPGSPVPTRKVIYAQKVMVGGETLIVGSDFYLATPIWMRF